ncbi:MAG: corrinoid protein [Clostridiales bacterium]|nr:corrinoid protein [Clostridiales bacterium]
MDELKKELLDIISEGVLEMDEEQVMKNCTKLLEAGYSALDGIMDGLVDGMNKASQLFDEEEYFVTDILLCSDAMYCGLDILRPHLTDNELNRDKPKGVIGVVQGDTHDIGKNLVKIMLETAGFEMYDLGRDVPLTDFVDKAKDVEADLICLSTLMTTTMGGMETVVKLLEEAGIRDQLKVIVGGGPISQSYSDLIGADGYSENAVEAVKLSKKLLDIV